MSTIFVRNLPWSTTNDELREFFTTNLPKAEVTSAEVQFNKQGRSKGWALVTFGSEDGAASAINELNDADFTSGDNTRQLQIREDRGAKAPRAAGTGAAQPVVDAEPSTSLFVGNLPWRTSWQDLKDMFADYNVQYTVSARSGIGGQLKCRRKELAGGAGRGGERIASSGVRTKGARKLIPAFNCAPLAQ